MNLPATALGSNLVALTSMARSSTSVAPRGSMRISAWLVSDRSQFHHSGKAGIAVSAVSRRDAAFGDDGLTAGQHVDERRDLLGAANWRLHRVRAKRQREEVVASERRECLARVRIRVDGGAQIRGEGVFGRAADRGVGGVPPAIGFSRHPHAADRAG